MRSDAHPVRVITLNQVIAWNMALYRRIAGLTQAELGERLGWPHHKVSEAERSWDGKRTREFDAQTLGGIALALGVPLVALLLPPDDDGHGVVYEICPPGAGEPVSMAEVMERVVLNDSHSDAPAMEAYRQRIRQKANKYLDSFWAAQVDEWQSPLDEKALAADRAERLRHRARMLMEYAEDDFEQAEFLDPEGAAKEEEGQ